MLGDAPPGNADWSVQAQQISESGCGRPLPADGVPGRGQRLPGGPAGWRRARCDDLPGRLRAHRVGADGREPRGSLVLDLLSSAQRADGGATGDARSARAVLRRRGGRRSRDDFVTIGWLIGEAFIEGLSVAGDCPTREAFITNLRQVTDYDANGMLDPPIDYSTALGTPFLLCTHFVTVENGEFVSEPEVTRCGEVIE